MKLKLTEEEIMQAIVDKLAEKLDLTSEEVGDIMFSYFPDNPKGAQVSVEVDIKLTED